MQSKLYDIYKNMFILICINVFFFLDLIVVYLNNFTICINNSHQALGFFSMLDFVPFHNLNLTISLIILL